MLVTYIDHMGTDLSVVNAAKVSFGKRSEWTHPTERKSDMFGTWYKKDRTKKVLSKQDQGLIQFLARGCTSGDWETLVNRCLEQGGAQQALWDQHPDLKDDSVEHLSVSLQMKDLLNHIRRMPSHWSPFAHTAISLHLKMPIFVARQIMKHTTGIEYNEVSRRYVDDEPEFYAPDVWRKKADNVKQGSSDEAVTKINVADYGENYWSDPGFTYSAYLESVSMLYDSMIRSNISPEQARMVLPQSMYTEVIATGNLYAWANLYVQRTDSHAQKETQDLAKQIGEIIQPLYPVSWEALTK